MSVPTIGRSLLGESGYEQLKARLKPGQQAIVVAGDGAYSFKGSGYVRGGIFDRIELLQEGQGTASATATTPGSATSPRTGAPDLREIALFVVPGGLQRSTSTEPWQLQLLVQRSVGARDKAFLTFDLDYTLPDRYLQDRAAALRRTPPASAAAGQARPAPPAAARRRRTAAAQRRGRARGRGDRGAALAQDLEDEHRLDRASPRRPARPDGIFFFQDCAGAPPTLYVWVRRGYLTFTLVWLGWYANAQLSVVNVLTFTNSLITGLQLGVLPRWPR